eukprot:Gb_03111 [translate_table: standard]
MFGNELCRLMGTKKGEGTRLLSLNDLKKTLEDKEGSKKLNKIKWIWLSDNKELFNLELEHINILSHSLRGLALGDWIRLDRPCHRTFANLRFLQVGDLDTLPFQYASQLENLTVFHNTSKLCLQLPPTLKELSLNPAPDDTRALLSDRMWNNITNLAGLRKLKLEKFKFKEFPTQEFQFASSLAELDLEGCKFLQNLPNQLCSFTAMRNLRLDGCESLNKLPENLSKLSSLEELCMQDCESITSLPERFGQLSSLRELVLSGCSNLERLPEHFGQLSSLQTLNLSNCFKLKDLPASLGSLTSLHDLELRLCTSLERLPVGFGNLSSIKSLNLYRLDSLVELPESIGNLSSLSKMDLHACRSLTSIPSVFGQLSSLNELLVFDYPKLSALPTDIGQLSSLKHIGLYKCSILETLELRRLKMLKLNGCKSLSTLPDGFGNLKFLKRLELSGCENLTRLPDEFGKLKSLETLDVSSCFKLERLSNDFECLSSLRVLNVSNSDKLEGVTMHKIVKLRSCHYVNIRGCLKLEEQWNEMQKEEDYPLVSKAEKKEYQRAASVALFQGQCELLDREGRYQLASDLIDNGATVAFIFPCTEELSPEVQREVLDRLNGSRAIPSTDIRTHSVCAKAFVLHYRYIATVDVKVDDKGRKLFVQTDIIFRKETDENSSTQNNIPELEAVLLLQILESKEMLTEIQSEEPTDIPYEELERDEQLSASRAENMSQSIPHMSNQSACTEKPNSFRRLREVLERNGIHHFIAKDGRKVEVDNIEGKLNAIFISIEANPAVVMRWGADAYPFTPQKVEVLDKQELIDMQCQSSLEFLLGESDGLDCSQTLVKKEFLRGKVVLLYLYSGHYDYRLGDLNKRKEKYEEAVEAMPWLRGWKLAEDRKAVESCPWVGGKEMVVVVDGDGEAVTGRGREMVEVMLSESSRDEDMKKERIEKMLSLVNSPKYPVVIGHLDLEAWEAVDYSEKMLAVVDGDGDTMTGRGREMVSR